MARFEQVLDQVRLALTLASPDEIQALMEDLVRERIISEAYGETLNLHRLTSSRWLQCDDRSRTNGPFDQSQEWKCETFTCTDLDFNLQRWESSVDEPNHPVFDEFYLDHYECSLDAESTEQLKCTQSLQEIESDSEGLIEGILEDEKEWLEQAARRIAVPLWQHWHQGQRMLQALVPHTTTSHATSENKKSGTESQCGLLNMEERKEIAVECSALDWYEDNFLSAEAEIAGFAEGFCLTPYEDMIDGSATDHFDTSWALGHSSGMKASAGTEHYSRDRLEDAFNVDSAADMTVNLEDLNGDHLGFQHFSFDILEDTCSDDPESSFYPDTNLSVTLGGTDSTENISRTSYITKASTQDGRGDMNEKKGEDGGTMMQELEMDASLLPDLGDLLEFFPELLNDPDDCLATIDTDVLNSWLSCSDVPDDYSDADMPTELPSEPQRPDRPPAQEQEYKQKCKTRNKRKRPRVPMPKKYDENTPSRPKRQRASGRLKTKETDIKSTVTQGTDTGSEPTSAEITATITTPPRIVHLHPSIQFITIPEAPGYQVVQTLSLSPPVLGLPLPNTATSPTYILVPTTSSPIKQQVPPLSPVNGVVAPVQMSSSPPGSLSDTASKAMSLPVASPLSPSSETSTSKESGLPQSPTVVIDVPESVKDYIKEAKTHVGQACQDMDEGLCLTSHYVDVQVSQRVVQAGKTTNKSLDKETVIMGNTDRERSLVERNQIFEGLNGDNPKRYLLLLGKTGMGKTTLIRQLCLDWSRNCFPQFDFVFLLDGKTLTLKEPSYSLQTLLLNHSSFAPPCMDPEAVYTQILAAPKRVLIILDGFDEVRDYEMLLQTQEKDLVASLQKDSKSQVYTVRQLYSAILQRVLLPGCTLLLSTRPRGTANQLLRRADSLMEMCGFTPTQVDKYMSQYFTDPTLKESALDYLKNSSYLNLLCWNPGLCRLVCFVLEEAKSLEELPRTLTGLCHQVLRLKLEKDRRSSSLLGEDQTSSPSVKEAEAGCRQQGSRKKSCSQVRSRTQRASRAKQQQRKDEVDEQEMNSTSRTEERELFSQLSSLAWEGVKSFSSILPKSCTISAKLRAFGHRTGLFHSCHQRKTQVVSSEDKEEKEMAREETGKGRKTGDRGRKGVETSNGLDDPITSWANPFLQSFLAGVHLSLTRSVTERTFLQNLPFQPGSKVRRRPLKEELELTQRFAFGLLFENRAELKRFHSYSETIFKDIIENKHALLRQHIDSISCGELSPDQVLEACHHIYEATFTRSDGSMDSSSMPLVAHLTVNLPDVITFCGVPLNPSDVYTVQSVLERGFEGRSFSLNLEDSGIQISGLRALVGLNNINSYRACIADVITLWEQLEQSGEETLLQGAVSKFSIHPFKVTQVHHIEHLDKLVKIHMHKRLSDSTSLSESIFSEGVPAVRELHKLEFGQQNGPLALPKLWELLPFLQNLQHLDLENSKIGDEGAEKLARAVGSLSCLEILMLSQNCIGDQGVKKLITTLKDLPKLHCLSLYSNQISDEGAESLAAVLPHMTSLTELDVKYNRLTDVGAQSLGASLRKCKQMKTLRMWNQCIPYGIFERLQQLDNRID